MHAASTAPPSLPDPAVGVEAEFREFLQSLSVYLAPQDVERVEAAYRFSEASHAGQFRISGDPYITHPLAVARYLAEWRLDPQALIAALLHDVMEDSGITKAELQTRFGKVSAELVDGVSKLDKIEFQSYEDAQAENFRKMFLAMARDVRVILIKLADRRHNMQTLYAVRPAKRRRIARETMEIYAPIANRLGLNSVYRELQDLSFENTYPRRHEVLSRALKAARGNRREGVGKVLAAMRERLAKGGLDAEVVGREKTVSSIYRKMAEKHLTFSQVLDIYGFRVVVKDVPSCYLALGVLHSLYKPVPGKFKDYIAIPKANGYQSLHTTLIGPYGAPIEVQIRTTEMHTVAETGVASHWLYKDSHKNLSELHQKTHKWLQSLLEIQSTSVDSAEFLEHVKVDLFPDEVYVFSPKGRILALPRGATPVDFAYAVHTDVGNRCVAARVNQELVPLRTELRNGDQVEIVTTNYANPNPAWLAFVKTAKARSHIRHVLKTAQYAESTRLGERLLDQALAELDSSLMAIDTATWDRVLKDTGARSPDEVLADIGLGKRMAAVVARRLLRRADTPKGDPKAMEPLLIRGTEGVAVALAKCCRPIPGDAIVGTIKKGVGLVVHATDCVAIAKSRARESDKWVDVEWDPVAGKSFESRIRVDAENRTGVLAKIASAIAESASNIENVTMETDGGPHTSIYFSIGVANRAHLARTMRALRRIAEVVRITRLRDGTPVSVQ